MRVHYFSSAWNDIKHSQGWFSKLLLLALLQFVPIFGQLVSLGYMFGWARDIAWDIHAPLPKKIFADTDGSMYLRGLFLLVVSVVFYVVPYLLWAIILIANLDSLILWRTTEEMMAAVVHVTLLSLLVVLLMIILMPFVWVGWMRASVYNRLAPGLQLSKIAAMVKHDFGGIMRIFGMYLLLTLIAGILYSAMNSMVVAAIMFIPGMSVLSSGSAGSAGSATALGMLATSGVSTVLSFGLLVMTSFIQLALARALGYWTRGFNVAAWGGPKDPLPFQRPTPAPPQGQPLVAAAPPASPAVPAGSVAQPANPAYPVPAVSVDSDAPQAGAQSAPGIKDNLPSEQTETKE